MGIRQGLVIKPLISLYDNKTSLVIINSVHETITLCTVGCCDLNGFPKWKVGFRDGSLLWWAFIPQQCLRYLGIVYCQPRMTTHTHISLSSQNIWKFSLSAPQYVCHTNFGWPSLLFDAITATLVSLTFQSLCKVPIMKGLLLLLRWLKRVYNFVILRIEIVDGEMTTDLWVKPKIINSLVKLLTDVYA